jgi:glycosyltransferase involved in cell wall biosynthesis
VVQVVPEHTRDDQTSAFAQRLLWRDCRLEPLRRWRMRALASALDEQRVNVLHALDGRLWSGALALARRLRVPVVLNVASVRDVARAARLRRHLRRCRAAFSVATHPLHDAIQGPARAGSASVELIPLGAHVPPAPNAPPDDQALCVVITGDGTFGPEYRGLLEALVQFRAERPGALFFFDSQGADSHQLWQAAQRHGLLPSVSMIPLHSDRRHLLSGAHVLLQPQPLGRARSFTLAAMAVGLPLLAREDPWLDYLHDDQTAWVSPTGSAASWAALLRRTVEEPEAARRLGASARAWARQNHLAATQVDRTMRLYRRLTGETYRFPQTPAHPEH